MPPFLDRVQLHQAVSSQAIPALEAIAANNNLRSLRRFERDDPPPYASSTESDEPDEYVLAPPQRRREMQDEVKAIMDRPFDDSELDEIASILEPIVYPAKYYYSEALNEHNRLDNHVRGPRPLMFRELKGSRRQGVIVRHNVKRRWEKLGVWNPEWGFAGRKTQPRDDIDTWKWPWQQHARPDGVDPYAHELVARALRLRRNLQRGEHAPVLPRSRLGQDTTAAQAEAFLISRPWFIFQIEIVEERVRYTRLSADDQRRFPRSSFRQVIDWWTERGDWRAEFSRRNRVTAWKWRHESPSPEPEDLTPVDNMRDSPLEAAEEMEFTPSEVDDLETIELPESEQPERYWTIDDGDLPPFFPGQMVDNMAQIRKRQKERVEKLEKAKAEGYKSRSDLVYEAFKAKFFPGGEPVRLFGPLKPAQDEESVPEELQASIELQEDAPEPQQHGAGLPPQKRRRMRQRQPRDDVDGAQTQDQPLPPPLRRSTRVAGIKRPAEPLPSEAAPKRPRGRPAAPRATAVVAKPKRSAEPLPSQPVSKRPRGRPAAPKSIAKPARPPTKREDEDSGEARTGASEEGGWTKRVFRRAEKTSDGIGSGRD
ncbi:hypothetical protein F5B18DRAFT_631851 [Nemania serpens]|nr:hypothetical protein F5B18DRAFT_631851 [Nemania serpens]